MRWLGWCGLRSDVMVWDEFDRSGQVAPRPRQRNETGREVGWGWGWGACRASPRRRRRELRQRRLRGKGLRSFCPPGPVPRLRLRLWPAPGSRPGLFGGWWGKRAVVDSWDGERGRQADGSRTRGCSGHGFAANCRYGVRSLDARASMASYRIFALMAFQLTHSTGGSRSQGKLVPEACRIPTFLVPAVSRAGPGPRDNANGVRYVRLCESRLMTSFL